MGELQLTKNTQTLKQAWFMLCWLLILQVLVSLLGRSISPLAPLLADDFMLSKFQVGLLPSAFFLGQLLISLPAGFLTDRYGSRTMMLALIIILGTSVGGIALMTNLGLLLFFVFLAGLSYGFIHPVTNRGIIYWFPAEKRGTAMGIKQMGVTAGSALSVVILLPLALEWGWRNTLFISVLILFVIGFASYLFYRDTSAANVHMHVRLTTFFSSIGQLLKEKPLLFVTFSAMGLNAIQMTLNTYLIFYVHEQLKFTLFVAGSLLLLSEISGAVGRIAWGVISDRFFGGRRIIILLILAILSFLGCLLMAFMLEGVILWLVVLATIFLGLSVSGFNGIWMNVATESVSREKAGLVSGFSITFGSFGVVLGPPIFGFILETTQSYMVAWLLLGGLSILVFLFTLWAGVLYKKAELNM